MAIAAFGLTYEEFVTKYLNKRGPNGMYWNMDAIAVATGTDISVLTGFLYHAQAVNYEIVSKTGKSATEKQLLEG